MVKVLVSACLLGEKVRYHGGDASCIHPLLERWLAEGRIVRVCPEVAGGLPVPRPPAELQGGTGADVLAGRARLIAISGVDVTDAFVAGARLALERAHAEGVRLAVLKDGSPSCGTTVVHDGSFTGATRRGQGVAAALLVRAGIRVFSEHQLDEAGVYLDRLEQERA